VLSAILTLRPLKDFHRNRLPLALKLGRGLHSLTPELNFRTFGNTLLPLELNLSTFAPRPRIIWVVWRTR